MAFMFLHSERPRGTDLDESLSDGQRQAIRDNVGHAAAVAIPDQSLDRDQSVRLA